MHTYACTNFSITNLTVNKNNCISYRQNYKLHLATTVAKLQNMVHKTMNQNYVAMYTVFAKCNIYIIMYVKM